MKLGVPTLHRYDLLSRLLQSAERGTLVPDEYVVVDNGGTYTPPPALAAKIRLIRPGENLGVAASWNRILEEAGDAVVISNDDVELAPATFAGLAAAVSAAQPLCHAGGWDLFAQHPSLVERIGWYDENFWPAYYEDNDYARRMKLAGIAETPVWVPHMHVGSATGKSTKDWAVTTGFRRSHDYFRIKWGGTPLREEYTEPFGGKPPEGWTERRPVKRWRYRLLKRTGVDHIYRRKRRYVVED